MIVTKLPRRTVRRLKALGLAYEENGVLFPTALGVTMKGARNLAQGSRDHQEEEVTKRSSPATAVTTWELKTERRCDS